MRRATRIAAVLVGALAAAPPALADPTMTIPAGYQAQISGASLNGCDSDAYGYKLDGPATSLPTVGLASKAGGCPLGITAAAGGSTPVAPTEETLRLYLTDNDCGAIYYSDGTGAANHASVVQAPDGSYSIRINDAGTSCGSEYVSSIPAAPNGDLIATVTLVAGPPVLSVLAPTPPDGQSGLFNANDVAGGGVPVTVSAADPTGHGISALACTDNGSAIPVTDESVSGANETGRITVSGTGTHAISCTASSVVSPSAGSAATTVAIDAEPPELTVPALPLTVQAPKPVSSYPISASDPQGDIPAVTCSPAAPATFPVGWSTVTCRAVDQAGNVTTRSFSVHVLAPPPVKPRLTAVSESAAVWRTSSRLPHISRTRYRVGTRFSFTLDQRARVRMAFTRVSPRRRGAPAGSLTFTGHPGRNAVSFSGRVSRSAKPLAPGHYTLTVAATNSAGTTRSRALAFTVV